MKVQTLQALMIYQYYLYVKIIIFLFIQNCLIEDLYENDVKKHVAYVIVSRRTYLRHIKVSWMNPANVVDLQLRHGVQSLNLYETGVKLLAESVKAAMFAKTLPTDAERLQPRKTVPRARRFKLDAKNPATAVCAVRNMIALGMIKYA